MDESRLGTSIFSDNMNELLYNTESVIARTFSKLNWHRHCSDATGKRNSNKFH